MVETCGPIVRHASRSTAPSPIMTSPGLAFQGQTAVTDSTIDPAQQLGRKRQRAPRFPDPEPAARHLLRAKGGGAPGSRSATISSTLPRSPTCSTSAGARICRSRCSTPGWRADRAPSGPSAAAFGAPVGRALPRRRRAAADRPERGADARALPRSATTPISTSASTTRPMSASCSGPTIRCCPTTNMCRSAITAARARSAPSGEASSGRAASARRPTPMRPNMARADASTMSSSSASGSGRQRARSADPDRRGGRAYRRLLPAQRLVGARPSGVGISAARAVPGQELPDQRSPWVVSPQALAPFRKPMPPRPDGDPEAARLPRRCSRPRERRARHPARSHLTTEDARRWLAPHVLSRGSADAAMYWSAAQIVAHHSSNGCNLQPGDLIGTGTLSTDSDAGLGSLLEISQRRQAAARLRTAKRAASSRTATK